MITILKTCTNTCRSENRDRKRADISLEDETAGPVELRDGDSEGITNGPCNGS